MGKFAAAERVEFDDVRRGATEWCGGPVIDLVHLSRQTLGDSGLETELLSLFDRQARQFANRLSAPFKTGDIKWRADLAHTLKGSAKAVGAFQLAEAAEAYEGSLRAGGSDIDAAFAHLQAAIERVHGEIAGLL